MPSKRRLPANPESDGGSRGRRRIKRIATPGELAQEDQGLPTRNKEPKHAGDGPPARQ